ncbi:MAG: hypothetical protein AAGB93_20570 [Planctomycetota bacterium]
MKQLLAAFAVCLAGSGVVAFVVASSVAPAPAAGPTALAARSANAGATVEPGGEASDVTDLRMHVAELEARIAELETARGAAPRAPVLMQSDAPAPGLALATELAGLDERGEEAFRAQVTRVLAEIDEEREAAERAEELEERAQQAADAYAAYDALERDLDASVAKLGGKLGLDGGRMRDMKSLLGVQNQRNRELTRMWESGEFGDEELGEIFNENRANHRAEILALVGRANLGDYQRFLQEKGLGDTFNYFVAPWENWTDGDPGR